MRRWRLEVPVGNAAPAGVESIIVELFAPPADRRPDGSEQCYEVPVLVCCLPGGGMNRGYFDLRSEGLTGYSMAEHLAARHGLWVLTIDHPGVGESDRPDDGFALTPAVVAAVNAMVISIVVDGLRAGSLVEGLPATPGLALVGVGHSMGGLLAVVQQARHGTFSALGVLGFSGRGLNEHLNDDERAVAHDQDAIEAAIVELTRARFGRALPPGATSTSGMLTVDGLPEAVIDELGRTAASLITVCGLTSMIPGSTRREREAVTVPVFVGVGEHDITGPVELLAGDFPNAPTAVFVLPGAKHNHNVEPDRHVLWERLATWIAAVTSRR